MIYRINPVNPQPRLIGQVVEILKNGGVIAYPTDTQYGIGCNLFDKKAIERVYRLRKRKPQKPFSFICADLTDISRYAKVSNTAYRTMKRLLPGPYTFILPGTRLVPRIMLTSRKEAGIRVPASVICLELVARLGNPIINTTAALPEGEVLHDPQEIEEAFKGQLDAVIDCGAGVPNKPSTVVSLLGETPEIVRVGLGDPGLV